MGMSRAELIAQGERLAAAQKKAGIRTFEPPDQVRVEAIGFDEWGNPTVVVADGVVTDVVGGWVAVGRILAGDVGKKERVWTRINKKRKPKIIGG